jgi:SAM-dependent methyltransferase
VHEVARVLRPGGVFAVSFSNRWFPTKVTIIWLSLHEFERMSWVEELFLQSRKFRSMETHTYRNWPRPESDAHYYQTRIADPVFMVTGKKI